MCPRRRGPPTCWTASGPCPRRKATIRSRLSAARPITCRWKCATRSAGIGSGRPTTRPRRSARCTSCTPQSVGRGANLLLNVPPDKTGRIPQEYVDALMELKRVIDNPALLGQLPQAGVAGLRLSRQGIQRLGASSAVGRRERRGRRPLHFLEGPRRREAGLAGGRSRQADDLRSRANHRGRQPRAEI